MSEQEAICEECGHDIPCRCRGYRIKTLKAENERLSNANTALDHALQIADEQLNASRATNARLRQECIDREDCEQSLTRQVLELQEQLNRALVALKNLIFQIEGTLPGPGFQGIGMNRHKDLLTKQWSPEWRTEETP